jgi:hypothetical protein
MLVMAVSSAWRDGMARAPAGRTALRWVWADLGRCVMTGPLRDQLADYLALRRALGYRLARPEKLLGQFLDYLELRGESRINHDRGAGLGAAARKRRLELVGLPTVGRAWLRHPSARARPGPRGAGRGPTAPSRPAGPVRTCIPTPTSRR